tara:strand:+ start:1654 stop:2520 length:867 start_codon:yes stop_codon:yes gene_type:complete
MTIKQLGGVFGRNPTFNDVEVTDLTISGVVDATSATTTLGTNTVIQTADSGVGPSSSANELMVENADNAGITIATPENKAGAIFFGKPTGSAKGRLQYNHSGSGGYMRFFTNDSEAARFTEAGHLDMTNGHDGNIILASGSGIDFSATAGTGTSELFDDYEEGTWTPTLIGTTSGSAVITVTEAVYTKIGRQVFVSARVTADLSSHSVVGSCEIGGLPYTTSPTDMGGGSSAYCAWFTTDLTTTSVHFRPIGTRLRLVKGSSSTSFSNGDLATSANALMMFYATYQVA